MTQGGLALLLLSVLVAAERVDTRALLDHWILDHAEPAVGSTANATASLPHSARAHLTALKQDPRHGSRWVVASAKGALDGAGTVIVVPQFHRSPVAPIVWSSLGQAIADVQDNIDALMSQLITHHGLRCVGTEGSWARRIERTDELDLVAGWGLELTARGDAVVAQLGDSDPDLAPAVRTLDHKLAPYLTRCLRMLDGVGMTQARLRALPSPLNPPLLRFGLEDKQLNQRAVQLAARSNEVYLRLAELLPEQQSAGQDAVGAMWIAEYPGFVSNTAQHLVQALDTLARARRDLHQDQAVDDARLLARYAGLAQEVTTRVLQLDAVAERYQHELAVIRRERAASAVPGERHLSRAEQRELKRLRTKADALDAQYEEITGRQREHQAVARTLAELRRAPNQICALVMGASHGEALVEELLRASAQGVGVLLVQPFPPDDETEEAAGGPVPDAGTADARAP